MELKIYVDAGLLEPIAGIANVNGNDIETQVVELLEQACDYHMRKNTVYMKENMDGEVTGEMNLCFSKEIINRCSEYVQAMRMPISNFIELMVKWGLDSFDAGDAEMIEKIRNS